ncbi:hypothetical protein CIK05_02760 [Bdellovibrio sp. qaytius]|nr:hypothetical protein CIK05_02760 [Bdellovibrio sp. qaytius]
MVFEQLKLTLKSFSILKNQHQALVTLDFDKNQRREALMRLCFSPLAAWPLLLVLLFLIINPLRYNLSLTNMLGMENILVQTFFGMDWLYAAILCLFVFAVSFYTRKESLMIAMVGFFISQGDMHLLMGLSLLACIVLARLLTNLRWVRSLESHTKSVWLVTSILSFISWALAVHLSFQMYNYLLQAGFFSQSMYANRLEFFILVVCLYYGLELIVLSVWGHFYTLKNPEPSEFTIKYSSSRLLKKLTLGYRFKDDLKDQIIVIKNNQRVYENADLDLLPKRLVELHRKEESFLTTALSALT